MPFGRGFGGRFAGSWGGFYPAWGWGRGNPYPFCRNFPWLPRGWWAMPYLGGYQTHPFWYASPYGSRFRPYPPF